VVRFKHLTALLAPEVEFNLASYCSSELLKPAMLTPQHVTARALRGK
jgi:hypothetical protein